MFKMVLARMSEVRKQEMVGFNRKVALCTKLKFRYP